MIAVRTPSLITNTLPLLFADVSLIRISLLGPSIMNRGRIPAKSMNSSTTNPGGAVTDAPSGLGTTVALLRTDGVANGAGSSFQFTGLRPRWAETVTPMAETATSTSARAVLFMGGYYTGHEEQTHDRPGDPLHVGGALRRRRVEMVRKLRRQGRRDADHRRHTGAHAPRRSDDGIQPDARHAQESGPRLRQSRRAPREIGRNHDRYSRQARVDASRSRRREGAEGVERRRGRRGQQRRVGARQH